jgi:hypothetical protein
MGIAVRHSAATVTTQHRITTPIRTMVMDSGRRLAFSFGGAGTFVVVVVITAVGDVSTEEAEVATGRGRVERETSIA